MSQLAQQIAERYRLHLSDDWQAWFNSDSEAIRLPGNFRACLPASRLMVEAPAEIWPGFMLPDTLPLVSNDYGDWICARTDSDGSFGELIHWYHGGGDWIPVGKQLAEMVVHDVVDQFRPVGQQMLRGAPESIEPQHQARVLADFDNSQLRPWLAKRLPMIAPSAGDSAAVSVHACLDELSRRLAAGEYLSSLEFLRDCNWAAEAVACDLIHFALQQPSSPLADRSIAQELAMDWTPDYVRLLFDFEQIPADIRSRMLAVASRREAQWPEQDWHRALSLAEEVLRRRQDLGWAVNIAGWSRQRAGDVAGAAEIYFAGRYASAFSDQAVRMRTHWIEPRYGKFTLAQLANLNGRLTPAQRADDYLATVTGTASHSPMRTVREYWIHAAGKHLDANSPAEAYACYYRAGWDLGAERLSEYEPILAGLVVSAQMAGWTARAAVAATHLACLRKRLA